MKTLETPDRVTLEPAAATHAVIWLHGLGADGHDFVPIVPALQLPPKLGVRYVFPHAPVRPVTIANGMPLRAWFDILDLNRRGVQDRAGIHASQQRIEALIDEQIALGIAPENILLAGFAQGGAMALQTALRSPHRLAGVMGLSTYLPLDSTLPAEASAANRRIPLLLQHGLYDPVLSFELGVASRDRLVELGYAVRWNQYPMQHEVSVEQIADVSAFMKEQLR